MVSLRLFFLGIAMIIFLFGAISAQTTAFNYQGSLGDGANVANGNYDFQFALFDAVSGGGQLGSTLARSNVSVANGIFAVSIDFGSQFPGASRFLEIRVRVSGSTEFTTLTPRQSVTSVPYSVKSLNADNAANATTANNALNLGGVAANQYVVTTDPRMSDARPPTSNFTISGNGTALGTLSGNVVNAVTQYNIGGMRVLASPGGSNLFAGIGAGAANAADGFSNSFFGSFAGQNNTTGDDNSFFGHVAGFSNTTGGNNSFFGRRAGENNTTGFSNAFFSQNAGLFNTSGNNNSFFGTSAGQNNSTASNNSFFGHSAGFGNSTGGANSFFGVNAGYANSTGSNNSAFGNGADVSVGDLTNATAIGNGAVVNASNKVRIGNSSVTVIEGQVAYTFTSDRNQKENFLAVNGRDVLRKIRGMNFTSWNYVGQDVNAFRHYGPMAQDFYAAFGTDKFGTSGSPTTINIGDLSGVMMAAIKQLSSENEVQKAKLDRQQSAISSQKTQINALKHQIEEQRAEIGAVKRLVCLQNRRAAICRLK